jgi:hypothetical protein
VTVLEPSDPKKIIYKDVTILPGQRILSAEKWDELLQSAVGNEEKQVPSQIAFHSRS